MHEAYERLISFIRRVNVEPVGREEMLHQSVNLRSGSRGGFLASVEVGPQQTEESVENDGPLRFFL